MLVPVSFHSLMKSLSTPPDTDNYGIGWTNLFTGSAVDAVGGAGRQAPSIRHLKTLDWTGVYALPTPSAFVPIHQGYKHPLFTASINFHS
jgi:hypothetical protein